MNQTIRKYSRHSRRAAFTMLELGIVIVAIGILAGAIMSGQVMLDRAKLRKVMIMGSNYRTAMEQFRQKYQYIPGDFPTATYVWGYASGSGANCTHPDTDASTGDATCNGDGDGRITLNNCEVYRAWQQLAAAKLVDGRFSGVSGLAGGCSPNSVPGTNVPAGVLKATGYSWVSLGDLASDPKFFDGNYDNTLMFGVARNSHYTVFGAIKPVEANELDEKIDDGVAATGYLRAMKGACVSGSNYMLTSSDKVCTLLFMPGLGLQNRAPD